MSRCDEIARRIEQCHGHIEAGFSLPIQTDQIDGDLRSTIVRPLPLHEKGARPSRLGGLAPILRHLALVAVGNVDRDRFAQWNGTTETRDRAALASPVGTMTERTSPTHWFL